MKLYCFSCAGGTAAFYDSIESYLHSEIDVVKLEYAGHGVRHRERFYADFFELSEDMYQHILLHYHDDEEYALFGYSMGSISVIETLKKITQYGEIAPPTHIFLAAHEPYARKELEGFGEEPLGDWVRKRIVEFGGIPECLLNNRSFWRVYLPVYCADYLMLGKYNFQQIDLKSKIPLTVFYSERDISYSRIKDWKHFFVGKCELVPFEGNHFFIYGHEREIAEIIKRNLKS